MTDHRYRCEYRYFTRFGHPKHWWTVIGRDGGVHLHIDDLADVAKDIQRFCGGLEFHWRNPQGDRPPDHDECWLLKGPCWHDGTSLYVEETVVPFWLVAPNDYERMFRFLEKEYDQHIAKKETTDD